MRTLRIYGKDNTVYKSWEIVKEIGDYLIVRRKVWKLWIFRIVNQYNRGGNMAIYNE